MVPGKRTKGIGHAKADRISEGRNFETVTKHTRREFLGLTGASIAGAIGAPWFGRMPLAAQTIDAQDADLVVLNAKVYTMDNRTPRAEAFAVKTGRFVAVGAS